MIDLSVIKLSLCFALVTSSLLILFSLPLAWFLSNQSEFKKLKLIILTLVTAPVILPPSVIGFYLLLLTGKNGLLANLGLGSYAFSFTGIVIGAFIYSLPFIIGPLISAFKEVPENLYFIARSFGAPKKDLFLRVALPKIRRSIISSFVLGFGHVLGQFGVILMIGGAIPNETKVISIALYESVENMDYSTAHQYSILLLIIAFSLILFSELLKNKRGKNV